VIDDTLDPARVIELLGLQPHVEGGHYAETYRAPAAAGERGAGTAIYFLLKAGERSHWHEVDAVEIWHWYAGAPLALAISENGLTSRTLTLGPDLLGGQRPQGIVPPHAWQAARSLGAWTLVGCTVSPSFDFGGFRLAPVGWEPGVSA
jgi:uncharacterized protein